MGLMRSRVYYQPRGQDINAQGRITIKMLLVNNVLGGPLISISKQSILTVGLDSLTRYHVTLVS